MNEPTGHWCDANAQEAAFFDEADPLSEHGQARRDAALPGLQAAVVREGRRRRARRSALRGAAVLSLLVAAGVTSVNLRPPANTPHEVVIPLTSESSKPGLGFVSIVRVDPGVLDRHTVHTSVDPGDYILDDKELVAALASIGRPTGLVRRQGRTWLTAAVTDAELTPQHGQPKGTPNPPLSSPRNRPS